MRVILSGRKFLHTIFRISVPVLWHMFNMKNRFYILRYLCSFFFQEPFSSQYVSGLSCRKRGSCHFILMGDNLRFQRISPDPFSLVSFPTLQLRHCSMNTGVFKRFLSLVFWCTYTTTHFRICQAFFWKYLVNFMHILFIKYIFIILFEHIKHFKIFIY